MKLRLLGLLVAAVLRAGEMAGSYSGTMTLQQQQVERSVPFAVVIHKTPLTVTCGPNLQEQHNASNPRLNGDNIEFELLPPGAAGNPAKFSLSLDADSLTGTMVMTRDGQSRTGKLSLKKQ
jgi:hypothetical protein